MSETPQTDQLEDSDFHKYGDDEAVPLSCYHRMTAHARDMEASAKAAAKMLGDAWLDIKQARAAAEHLRDSLCRPEWAKPIVFPWEDAAHGLDSENDQGHPARDENRPPERSDVYQPTD